MTIEIDAPARIAPQSRGLTRMLEQLSDQGWRVEIASAPSAARVSFALVARAPGEARERIVVLHGFLGAMEVQMKDVWGVVAHVNEIQGDTAVVCLGFKTTVSKMATDTADRIGVVFRRVPE
ncbi:MAG: hypothetical protein K8T90_18105 [Planctomycetes bacterium]|nr:hypothetical protein [Planctomycetota bacterium]